MAGGRHKKTFNTKPKSRKPTKSSSSSLFVDGGLLSDWSPVTSSPNPRGKNNNNNKCNSAGKTLNLNSSKKRYEIGGGSGGGSKETRMVESGRLKKNVFAYNYPQVSQVVDEGGGDGNNKFDESNPIVLVDSKESKIIAYMDEGPAGPVPDAETVSYSYDYGASFEVDDSTHVGLGFHVESEENTSVVEATPVTEKIEYSRFDSSSAREMETDMMDDDADDDIDDDDDDGGLSSQVTNSGFLSIGGMKFYTQDISCDEDDDEDGSDDVDDGSDDDDDDDDDSDDDSEDSCDSSDSDGAYNSDSEIDDEIAKDYFEGIGGSSKVANVDQLIGQILDSSDDEANGGRFNKMLKGVSGIALHDASREYGMRKPRTKNKSRARPSKYGAAADDWSAIDDLMLVKNSRSSYGKKKHAAKLPQSWPSKAEKSKSFRRFSGEKKKLRQDKIASKRRDRMISRGVDLEKINFKLEQMVKNKGDMISIHLTHSRDCSQVQRLAAIYRLQSGSQGSGRRRFVTVTRTQHTCMPSSADKIRLEKMLRMNDEANDTPVSKTPSNRIKKAGLGPLDPKSVKSNESSKKKRRDSDKTGTYAAQPVSFISSGNMVPEPEKAVMVDHQISSEDKPVASSSSYGAFEMHTTGFGSKMMAKMGYVDGGGLGKDGKGISEPIQVTQRPKSLGLGAMVPDTSEPMNVTPPPQKPNRSVGQSSRGSESRGKSRSGGQSSRGSESRGKSGFAGQSSRGSESRGNSGNVHIGSFEKHTKGFGSKMMAKMGFVEGMGLGRDSQGIVQPLVASKLPKSRGLGAKG